MLVTKQGQLPKQGLNHSTIFEINRNLGDTYGLG